jgi:hypothetical protein
MQKREIAWIVVLLLAIGSYFHFFSHWGEIKEIQINASVRPLVRRRGVAPGLVLWFTFDNFYKLTSLKLIEVDTQHTNAVDHILWHLVSKTGSSPVKMFQYGQNLGMEPYLQGVQPEPLVTGGKYRLEVSAGPINGVSKPFVFPAPPKPR